MPRFLEPGRLRRRLRHNREPRLYAPSRFGDKHDPARATAFPLSEYAQLHVAFRGASDILGSMLRTPHPIRNIIWDWNGTLLDDIDACMVSINTMLRRRGIAAVDVGKYRDAFGFPVRDFYTRVGFRLEAENWDSLCVEYHDLYEACAKTSPLQPGAADALKTFAADGLAMFVLSAAETSLLERMVNERDMRHFFVAMYGLSDLQARSKAHCGRALMHEHGHDGASTLLVGDTRHDYEVACEIGCRCVLMPGGHQSRERLARCGCDIVADMRGLIDYVREHTGTAGRHPGNQTRSGSDSAPARPQ